MTKVSLKWVKYILNISYQKFEEIRKIYNNKIHFFGGKSGSETIFFINNKSNHKISIFWGG